MRAASAEGNFLILITLKGFAGSLRSRDTSPEPRPADRIPREHLTSRERGADPRLSGDAVFGRLRRLYLSNTGMTLRTKERLKPRLLLLD